MTLMMKQLHPRLGDNTRTDPDEMVISRYLSEGSEADFATLLQRHGPMVWGVCRNLLLHEADAEDAFQAVFLALLQSMKRIRQKSNPGAWLHGAAVRICHTSRTQKLQRQRKETTAAQNRPEARLEARNDAVWQEQALQVHQSIAELPAKERAVFVRCVLEGEGQAEVARSLSLKLNTVSGLLSRARKRLQQTLRKARLASGAIPLVVSSTAFGMPHNIFLATCRMSNGSALPTPLIVSLSITLLEIPMRKVSLLAVVAIAGLSVAGLGKHWLEGRADAQDPAKAAAQDKQVVQGYPVNTDGPRDAYWAQYQEAVRYSPFSTVNAAGKWEYKVLNRIEYSSLEAKLNTLSQEGWDIVHVDNSQQGVSTNIILKRMKQTPTTVNGVYLDPAVSGLSAAVSRAYVPSELQKKENTSKEATVLIRNHSVEDLEKILKVLYSNSKFELTTNSVSNTMKLRCESALFEHIFKTIKGLDVEKPKPTGAPAGTPPSN